MTTGDPRNHLPPQEEDEKLSLNPYPSFHKLSTHIFIGEQPITLPLKNLDEPNNQARSIQLRCSSPSHSQEEATKLISSSPSNRSYAEIVKASSPKGEISSMGLRKSQASDMESLTLKPISVYHGKPAVVFPFSEKQVLVDKLSFVLVGKFSHGMPSLVKTRKFFNFLKLASLCTISVFDKKHIFIECSCKADFNYIWMQLTWIIDGFVMRVFRWTADFHPVKESAVVPVWIRLEGLPLYMFDEMPLMSIANSIGKPLKVDPRNVARTMVNCARICVELDLSKPLVDSMWISFEDEVSKEVREGFWVMVFYDVVPHFCHFCCHIGHSVGKCKRKIEQDLTMDATMVDADVQRLHNTQDRQNCLVPTCKGKQSIGDVGTSTTQTEIELKKQEGFQLQVVSGKEQVLGDHLKGYNESKNNHMAGMSSIKGCKQVKSMLANQTLRGSLGGNIAVVNVTDSVQNVWEEVQDSIMQEGEQKKHLVTQALERQVSVAGASVAARAAGGVGEPHRKTEKVVAVEVYEDEVSVEDLTLEEGEIHENNAGGSDEGRSVAGDQAAVSVAELNAPVAGNSAMEHVAVDPMITAATAVLMSAVGMGAETHVQEEAADGEQDLGKPSGAAGGLTRMLHHAGETAGYQELIDGETRDCVGAAVENKLVQITTLSVLHQISTGQQEAAKATGSAGAEDNCSPDQQDVKLNSDHQVEQANVNKVNTSVVSPSWADLVETEAEEKIDCSHVFCGKHERVGTAGLLCVAEGYSLGTNCSRDKTQQEQSQSVGADLGLKEAKCAGESITESAGAGNPAVSFSKELQQGNPQECLWPSKQQVEELTERMNRLRGKEPDRREELVVSGNNTAGSHKPAGFWSVMEGYAMDEIEMIMTSPTRIGPVFARTVPKIINASILDLEGSPVRCSEVIRNSARIADVRKHFHFLSNEKLVATLVEQGKYKEVIKDAMKTYTKEIHRTLLEQEKSIYPKHSTTENATSMTQEAIPKVSTMDEKEWTTPKRRGRNRNRSK